MSKGLKNKEVDVQELWRKRENLAESIRIRHQELEGLRWEFQKSIAPKLDHLNKLHEEMQQIESTLYEIGELEI